MKREGRDPTAPTHAGGSSDPPLLADHHSHLRALHPRVRSTLPQTAPVMISLAARHIFDMLGVGQNEVKFPSKMFHTGFQYTPVLSIATCVTRSSISHAARARKSAVIVLNRRKYFSSLPRSPCKRT